MDLRDVETRIARLLEPRQVGIDDGGVALEREDQRDVDRDPRRDRRRDGGESGLRRGDLDEGVGAVDALPQLGRLGRRAVGVVREVGRDLDRDATVDAARLIENGTEDVGCIAHIGRREREDRLVGRRAFAGEIGEGRVVRTVVGVADRTREDRRVGRDARDVARVDQLLQVARRDARAREVIEPDADAGCGEVCGRGAHAFSWMVSWAASTT